MGGVANNAKRPRNNTRAAKVGNGPCPNTMGGVANNAKRPRSNGSTPRDTVNRGNRPIGSVIPLGFDHIPSVGAYQSGKNQGLELITSMVTQRENLSFHATHRTDTGREEEDKNSDKT